MAAAEAVPLAISWRNITSSPAIEARIRREARKLGKLHLGITDCRVQVAAPHSPGNTKSIDEFRDIKVDLAYIGACTGAKLVDLRMAAQILKNRRSTVKLLVAPASLRDQQAAEKEGTLQVLLDAGAELLANSCGMCAGYGEHLLPENAVAISTTARNFKGRMGAATAQVYLASPYTVAASAVTGRISDPRAMLA